MKGVEAFVANEAVTQTAKGQSSDAPNQCQATLFRTTAKEFLADDSILCNGFPTGVEVCDAMVHGGPFPATSDCRTTSVGSAAILRFLRPVCYQDVPAALLPAELGDENKLSVRRLQNGAY